MKTLVSALMISASVLAGTAYADDSSSPTREQVVTELQQARAAGLISNGEEAYPVTVRSASTENRTQVQEELSAAVAAGQVNIGEDVEYPPVTVAGNIATRPEVKNGLPN
ncbi:MAG TPA: DUF4148 domain-containing protein [Candidimonas sp.]|nr:DUF4148 domain-containing protein [Candidimonas sp.]